MKGKVEISLKCASEVAEFGGSGVVWRKRKIWGVMVDYLSMDERRGQYLDSVKISSNICEIILLK
jgi:hypothetical protein